MHSKKRHKKPVDENVNKQKKARSEWDHFTQQSNEQERERESASQATAADSKCLIHFGINENEKKIVYREKK